MNEKAFQKLINNYSEIETKILEELVKHFKINEEFINSDYFRFEKLQELGILNDNIIKYIAEATKSTPMQIKKAINEIGFETFNINELNKAYSGGFLQIDPDILIQKNIIQNLIDYSYNELEDRFLSISKKIENGAREAYLDIVEKVYLQTTSGVTYDGAIRSALADLGERGITTLTYRTIDSEGNTIGIRNYDVEGAVRREVVTANNKLVNEINKSVAEELDVEYVLLSEHIACRPQHFPWQGTIIKRKDIEAVTKYGEVDGMGGPNCKHYPTPYFGSARGNELKQISLEEATKKYELSQKQRYIERNIRKWKRKARIFETAEDKEYYKKCKDKVKEWQTKNREFTENNNLIRDFSRENVEKINKRDIILTDKEQYAINQYVSSDFYSINEKLRNGIELSQDEMAMTKNLDNAMNKLHIYQGMVTRSLQLDDTALQEFISIHKENKIVEYRAYTSTTKGERYNELSNVELYINSKTGKTLEKYNKEEQEILFKRGSLFKVKEIEKIKNTYHILLEDINGK